MGHAHSAVNDSTATDISHLVKNVELKQKTSNISQSTNKGTNIIARKLEFPGNLYEVSFSIIEGRSIGAVELKSTLGWPCLQARRNYLKCVLVHKCLHGIVPSYLLSEFRHAHLFHGYNARSRDLLRPPFAKTTKYQGSFRINGARTYNTLPRIIKQVDTLSEFKIKLKRHFKQ